MLRLVAVLASALLIGASAGCSQESTELHAVSQALDEPTLGSWSAPVTWPFVAIHTSVLPDGMVLSWGRTEEHDTMSASLWNPATGTLTPVPNEHTNLFCSGHSLLPDGRLLVTGGHIHDQEGPADSNIFDYRTRTWSMGPAMNAGRWYPTNTTLGTGEVLVVGGSISYGVINALPQVFTTSGTWRSLTNASRTQPWYPFMHVTPTGSVFYAGPEAITAMLYTKGNGGWVPFARRADSSYRDYGTSVVYAPGKILTTGGRDPNTGFLNSAETIDLNAANPVWTAARPMAYARQHLNGTLLPDGSILVIGGLGPNGAVFATERWNPQTGNWTTLASNQVPRLYHSTAVLLPDGRVFSGGGGQPGIPPYGDYYSIEVYSPPYLFQGARPTMTSAPAAVSYGGGFQITTPNSSAISRVTWVRLGAVTHAYDQNQRFAELTFTRPNATTLQVTAPTSSNDVPPGHYLMFVLDAAGVPSVGRTIQINGTLQPAPNVPLARSVADLAFYTANNRVICADANGILSAACTRLANGQAFRFVPFQPNGRFVALRAPNGKYVAAEGGGGGVLVADRTAIGPWETFERIPLGQGVFALRTLNGRYVTAVNGGGGALTATKSSPGAYETFQEARVSTVALRTSSGHYISAEGGGSGSLVANRTAIGGWETFQLLTFSNATAALQATNGLYVTAEYGGGSSLVSNRNELGSWETYRITANTNRSSLRVSNNQYVCAEGGGGGALVANRTSPGPWETFEFVCLNSKTFCGAGCTDLKNDSLNCNGCGVACADHQRCVNGGCQ